MGVHTEPSTILPEVFLGHGSFKVRRSSGNVSIMIVNDKGKTHFDLKKQSVYVDMCDDNHSIFKTVEINDRFIDDNSELNLVGSTLTVGTSAIAEEISTIWRATVGVLDESTIAMAPSDLTEVVVPSDDEEPAEEDPEEPEVEETEAEGDDKPEAAEEPEGEKTPVPSPGPKTAAEPEPEKEEPLKAAEPEKEKPPKTAEPEYWW